MTTDVTPWQNVGEPTAGFFASDSDLPPGLPYEQVVALRSLELAERAEEQRRQEELADAEMFTTLLAVRPRSVGATKLLVCQARLHGGQQHAQRLA
jgi:hypothetical protein